MIAPLLVFESSTLTAIPKAVTKALLAADIYGCPQSHLGRYTLSGNYDLESAREVVAEIKKSEHRKIIMFGPRVADAFGLLNGSNALDVYEDGYRSYIVLPDAFMDKWWNAYDDYVIDKLKGFLNEGNTERKYIR